MILHNNCISSQGFVYKMPFLGKTKYISITFAFTICLIEFDALHFSFLTRSVHYLSKYWWGFEN